RGPPPLPRPEAGKRREGLLPGQSSKSCAFVPLKLKQARPGEGVTAYHVKLNPSPGSRASARDPTSPSRSRIYPTSAGSKCRTRVNPSSGGRGPHAALSRHDRISSKVALGQLFIGG